MLTQRCLAALTAANLGLLLFLAGRAVFPAEAESAPAVLRGRALEIVDAHGRVRASIRLHAAGTAVGERHPETVMLRLIDAQGRPSVKIGGSAEGGAVGVVGETDATQALLSARGAESLLKLTDKAGRERLLKP
jgi:hypothetical protein